MNIFNRDPVELGLQCYVETVAAAPDVGSEATLCEYDGSANAYIALAEPLPGFPDRDAALLWDDTHGWSLCVETHSGEDLIVLAYLTTALLPDPQTVAAFVAKTRSRRNLDSPRLLPTHSFCELHKRLLGYPS